MSYDLEGVGGGEEKNVAVEGGAKQAIMGRNI